MKNLTSRTIFLCTSSSYTIPCPYFFSHHCLFSYSSSTEESSKRRGGTSQNSSSSSWRHHDDESRNVKVSVWWDFENCSVPYGTNVFRVTQRITSALRTNGMKGPITITAFGDVMQLSRSNQEALSSTGVCLNHIPHGGKNSADRSLLIDLVYWVSQNPPPAHLFLISGDRDFANVLHRMRMNNYNILLASTDSAPGVLCSAASIMWQWNALVKGESQTAKHFNQPPDGPYGSWYGYHKGPLDDPFLEMEQPACSHPEDLPEAGLDSKPRPVPKAFLRQIRQILNLYPKGIPITTLRAELAKSNVTMDKDLFGHKKFSRLLLSMPSVLKLQPGGDGQMLCILANSAEPVESNSKLSTGPETNDGDGDQAAIVEQNGEDSAKTAYVNEKSLSSPPAPPLKVEEPPPLAQKEINEPVTVGHPPANVEKQDSTSEIGFFHRIWRTWFSYKSGVSNEKGDSIPEKCGTTDFSKKTKSEQKSFGSVNGPTPSKSSNEKRDSIREKCGTTDCPKKAKSEEKSSGSVTCSTSSSSSLLNATQTVQDENVAKDSEGSDEKSGSSEGLFRKIVNWCGFWRISRIPDNDDNGQCHKELNKHNELFSRDFFWTEMDLFIHTPKGSILVSQSKTREQMGQKLQKEGPIVLNNLIESDLLHLVDLLISEKKWVEECPSQTFPFKPIHHARTGSSNLPGSTGLSSIFSAKLSQSESKLRGLPEHGVEKKDRSQFQPAACSTESNKRPSGTGKARHEILADCKKLVTEILEEYPEGFNMGSFKRLFVERYGYVLDYQMLGYSKLAPLLQTMPEVKIEYTYILPAKKASGYQGSDIAPPFSYSVENHGIGKLSNSDGELSDSARKENHRDSLWEELGQITGTSSYRYDSGLKLNGEAKIEMKGQMDFDDDCLSEDKLSDSGENVKLDRTEGLDKSRCEEDSSLLQILDSWYSSKDDSGSNGQSQKVEEVMDSSRIGSKSSSSSRAETKSKSSVANSGHKIKPMKKISFVSDPVGDDKEKLIDNILGSLKKSAETKMES
ncbi:uncharacterized protein LOC122073867 [Macadamia integrifolia]|uniref:uncharacterized protein LOC122073867 n=1 Tax=Macadamia integrifolia TaxID=60698 RepID=UPI001C4E3825|nr:uncharacterized protein LOC122073867 [Macadamia integrifolia]